MPCACLSFCTRAVGCYDTICEAGYSVVELVRNLVAHGDAREGKWRGKWGMEWVASTLTPPPNVVYPALLKLMRTPRLPAVDWTDASTDLNGLVHFWEIRNLVSARVPSRSARAIRYIRTDSSFGGEAKEDPVDTVQPNSGRLLHAKIKVAFACFRHNSMRRYERDNLQFQTSLPSVLIKGSFREPVSLYPRKVSPLSFNTCLDGLNGLEKNKSLWPWPNSKHISRLSRLHFTVWAVPSLHAVNKIASLSLAHQYFKSYSNFKCAGYRSVVS